jgi:hypothetical protein
VINLSASGKDDIEEQLRRDKLKCCRWCEKLSKSEILWPTEKVDGSRFFGPNFEKKCQKVIYRDLSKIRPHKKHCAWARTPPLGENIKFIDFYRNLPFLGLQYSRKNRHQSRHLRPTPPREEPKSGKNRNFSKII